MPVPTHGPRCRKLFCRPSRCMDCRQEIFHWACTCGSNVLFDKLGEPWPQHKCTGSAASTLGTKKPTKNKGRSNNGTPTNAKPISTYTYGVSSIVCIRCGKSVRKREMDAHNYWTHGIGKKPDPGRPSRPVENPRLAPGPARRSGAANTNKTLVVCPRCGAKVLEKNLQKHLTKRCPKT